MKLDRALSTPSVALCEIQSLQLYYDLGLRLTQTAYMWWYYLSSVTIKYKKN